MEENEKDAKRRLFDRLDECLIENAVSFGKSFSDPSTDDVYLLRDLADRHYFLTTQHEFTPAEVDALLSFDDPLFVAETCWCEKGESGDLDICAALDGIHAYDRFDLSLDERKRRFEPKVQRLKELLGENYANYTAALMGMSKQELIEKSVEIAAVQDAYSFLTEKFTFSFAEVEHLLKMRAPLFFLADGWIVPAEDRTDMDIFVHEVLRDLDSPAYLAQMADAYPTFSSKSADKPSIRDQLHKAAQEAGQHPSQASLPQRRSDTPNL